MPTTLAIRVIMTAFPIVAMIALIPFVQNDYLLTAIYIGIIAVSAFRYSRQDFIFLVFGFFILLAGETFFLLTGVETFERRTFLGIMPLWLPFLWAYIFVAMKRSVQLFERYLQG